MSVQKMALRKLMTVIFAASRSVWVSSCEACLFLETGGSAVQSHLDVAVHGRKGLFMMSECKRILNKEVTGEGLWQTDLSKCQGQQDGEVLEIQAADEEDHQECNHGSLFPHAISKQTDLAASICFEITLSGCIAFKPYDP